MNPGVLRAKNHGTASVNALYIRMTAWAGLRGNTLRDTAATLPNLDAETM